LGRQQCQISTQMTLIQLLHIILHFQKPYILIKKILQLSKKERKKKNKLPPFLQLFHIFSTNKIESLHFSMTNQQTKQKKIQQHGKNPLKFTQTSKKKNQISQKQKKGT